MSEEVESKFKIKNPYERILWNLRGTIREGFNCLLLGKILTVIDSAIPEEKQNKAVKDLIKSYFFQETKNYRNYLEKTVSRIAKEENQEIKTGQEPSPI